MITILIKDNGEKKVTDMTYELLYRELKDIPNAEMRVVKDWVESLPEVKTKLVCFVESDCLVSSGYFSSLLGTLKKNSYELNKMAVLASTTAVKNWAVRFYGYNLGNSYSERIVPNLTKKQTKIPFYTIQIAYIPGAIMRTNFIRQIVKECNLPRNWYDDLVFFSTTVSLTLWKHNWMVYLAHNPTYCTTEDYVNDISVFELEDKTLLKKFKAESI